MLAFLISFWYAFLLQTEINLEYLTFCEISSTFSSIGPSS